LEYHQSVIDTTDFEPINHGIPQTPNPLEYPDRQEYTRHELPRLIRRGLETAFQEQNQPNGEHLMRQLPNTIQDSQDWLFARHATGATKSLPMMLPPRRQ
jgi:hypothetical protein